MTRKYSDDWLMTEKEVEETYGENRRTLQSDRARGTGLPWIKLGASKQSRVRYPKRLVDEYIRLRSAGRLNKSDPKAIDQG